MEQIEKRAIDHMKRKERSSKCKIMPDIASQQCKNKNQRMSQKIVQKDYATEKMLLIVLKAPSTV